MLDLLGEVVVRGYRGDRAAYRLLRSPLGTGTAPLALGRALIAEARAESIYVADLDAIMRKGSHDGLLRRIAGSLGVALWADTGVDTAKGTQALFALGASRVVIGSETLTSLAHLHQLLDEFPPELLPVSLDVSAGRVRSPAPRLGGAAPAEGARLLAAAGVSQLIALDLDGVGAANGPPWALLETIHEAFPPDRVIVGGGVRGAADIDELRRMGLRGALVSTALHTGQLEVRR